MFTVTQYSVDYSRHNHTDVLASDAFASVRVGRATSGKHTQWATFALAAAVLFTAALTTTQVVAQVDGMAWTMYRDPELATPKIQVLFPPGLVELWSEALKHPDRELRRRAASAIAKGPERGVTGLDVTVPQMTKMLEQPDQERVIRLTVARALVALDARQAAPQLLAGLHTSDLDWSETVEPALARWKFAPAAKLWRERLDTKITIRRLHVLAIQGLITLGNTEALPRMLEFATNRHTPTSVRVAAADALGQLQKTDLLEAARKLSQDKSSKGLVDRLVAAKMLAAHRGKEAEQLLAILSTDAIPSVQAIALRQLLQIDPQLVMPLADNTLASTDVNVRRIASTALIAVARTPMPENINKLSTRLDDRNPSLRRFVRDALIDLAKNKSLHDVVIEQSRRVLDLDGWRGQEQAIQVLVALDEKPIVDRLFTLLDSQRPEVHTTAAWGLCQLNVPATVERIFDVFETKTKRWQAGQRQAVGTENQLAHLAQAVGRMKYAPADKLLREYIPKSAPMNPTSRAAAIWAIGFLYVDKQDDKLASQLKARMTDIASMIPEDPLVRRMAAITLGRMKAKSTLKDLRRMAELEGATLATGLACYWSVHQITDEPMPKVPAIIFRDHNWFLVPESPTLLPDDPAASE